MSLELTIILGLQGSNFDGEVRPKLGTSRDDKSMRVEERSQSALGRNLRMEVREYLGRVGFRLSFKMKVTWPHLKVERCNPQMGNPKGEGIIYWLRCTWTCLKLEGAGSSKEGRQDEIAQHGGRIRGGPYSAVCGRLTDLSRLPFDYPMTILKPVRIHSSSINDISVIFRRPGHP